MELTLTPDMFVNNKYVQAYGARQEATFTIIDEEFKGINLLGRVNRLLCLVKKYNTDGSIASASLSTTVIGIGDGKVGVMCADPALRGKLMTKDNMELCVVKLYED